MAESVIPNPNRGGSYGDIINLLPYNSSTNLFTAPSDGYINVQCWNFDDSSLSLWFRATALEIRLTKSARQQFSIFARKGSAWWIGGSGNNRSASFIPFF